jgi:head-tail adaptor
MTLDFSKYNSLRGFSFYHMNKWISVKSGRFTPDQLGGLNEEWELIAEAWAKIIPMSNFKNTDLYNKKASFWIIMRYDPDIKGVIRIYTDEQVFDIGKTINIENKFTLMSAMEGNNHV